MAIQNNNLRKQQQQSQQNTGSNQSRRRESAQGESEGESTQGTRRARGVQAKEEGSSNERQDLIGAITPAFNEARQFIEGSPVRAAVIGAVAGSVLMTLFATERGRSLLQQGYSLANPWISKYAREFVSRAAGEATDKALLQ